jgi:hypothetical protein
MTGFEFSLIPVAIIVGFALTRILTCWGQIVRTWSNLHTPWLFLSYTVIAMAGVLSHFVGDWAYRDIDLHFGQLVLIVLPTLVMVLSISVMLPGETEFPSDLTKHYFVYVRKSSCLMGTGVLLSVIPDLFPGAVNVPEPWMVALVVAPLGLMAALRQQIVHIFAHVIMWVMLLAQMSSLTNFGTMY